MPRVIIQTNSGRSLDQKRGLVKDVTRAVCEHYQVGPEQVTIVLQEHEPENFAKGGVLSVDQGSPVGRGGDR
jgi:4-oxalocrotonate tautomerase